MRERDVKVGGAYIIAGARTLVIMRIAKTVLVLVIIILIKRRFRNRPEDTVLNRLYREVLYTYPASTAARSAWYRGVSVRPGWLLTTLTSWLSWSSDKWISPWRFLPTSARLCVAARVVEYAMAMNVSAAPRTRTEVRVPLAAPERKGLHISWV